MLLIWRVLWLQQYIWRSIWRSIDVDTDAKSDFLEDMFSPSPEQVLYAGLNSNPQFSFKLL